MNQPQVYDDGAPGRVSASHHLYEVGDAQYDSADRFDDEMPAISLAEIISILWERRLWLIAAGFAGLLVAIGYSLSQTPLYRSTATIELNPPTVPILTNGAGSAEEMVVPSTDYEFRETQIGILRSRALAERVVQDLDLVSAPSANAQGVQTGVEAAATSIGKGLAVQPTANSRLIELSYISPDPREAARLVNGFTDSYIQLTLDRKYEATIAARDFLEERIAAVRDEVNIAERELVDYAKANGIVMLGGEGPDSEGSTGSLTGDSLSSLNAALAAAQQKRITAEQRFRQASSIGEVNNSTAQLRQELASLQAEYREKSTYLQDSFPDLVRLRTRIDELERQISSETSRSVAALRAEYQAAQAEENSLQTRVAQLSSEALGEREDSIQYNILQRELDTNRTLYDALLSRYNEVSVAAGIGSAQAAVVDSGQVPDAPFSPNTVWNGILGLILGLAIGAGLAILYDRFTNTIKTKEDVKQKLGLAALGAIPKKEKQVELSDELMDPYSDIYESYANLQTTLQLSTSGGFPKTLLVTSANPEEGKSTTSYSLAVQLATIGKRVLLIDADMRKPTFSVDQHSDIGLATLLTSSGPAKDHVLSTSQKGLFLMPSGPIPPNAANIIRPARLRQILEELQNHFDVIVLDAPPTLGFADSSLLGSVCQGAVFTIESGKTRTRSALTGINQLQMSGVRLLGAVLTKAPPSAEDYSYSYRYYRQAVSENDPRRALIDTLADNHEGGGKWHKADL
ncbi:GumC family protein [Aurantiacibacter rhizosphaerae]|uniref:non-specific protein-tyrosine kinase n=1 Tax=Aurantiacibacter rhizosphaerae TaxID=2691582 RepID=A0A844XBE0_9SPHN|nr:polysaccharide biosynthesis tyrosine autokinase [Aurantiacibacter rhizosphaerae]MWV26954.1 polysaccharide biosynthesis tyrosine autokinase [Aurantiacibacter rhizosphaerae]